MIGPESFVGVGALSEGIEKKAACVSVVSAQERGGRER